MPPKKRLEAAASKAGRAAQRRRQGRLRDLRVGAAALKRYTEAVLRFCAWLWLEGELPAEQLQALDLQLVRYIESLWAEGDAKALAGNAISGVQHMLMVRRCFPAAWGVYSVWNRVEMPHRVPPMLLEIVLAMAGVFITRQRRDLAVAVLLGFHCMLRTGELLAVCGSTVQLNGAFCGLVALPLTKTSRRKGAQELVTVDDPFVGQLLASELGARPDAGPLVRGSAQAFRAHFSDALKELGVHGIGLQPYSLRRGGATHDYMQHGDVARTIMRGRWSDMKVAKIYIVDGAAVLAQTRLTSVQHDRLRHYRSRFLGMSG